MTKIIFGAAGYSDVRSFNNDEVRKEILDLLLAENVTTLDTARLYEGSEVAIGAQAQRTKFTIDTKLTGGFGPGNVTREGVVRDLNDSLARVGIDEFDVLYLHAPDDSVPITETLAGINDAHKKGGFRRFGLSNFSAEQVQEVHDIASKNGYVLPSVYQGNYNPVARHLETTLFPLLEKLGIAFYAYSPIAGGFLTKSAKELDDGVGRFSKQAIGGLYSKLYDKPSLREALIKWNEVAEAEGVSNAELAYRWVAHHSPLAQAWSEENGVIIGASKVAQVKETIGAIKKGKLSGDAVKEIDGIWESVKNDAPIDNYHSSRS